MRLYRGKVRILARELIEKLIKAKAIEVLPQNIDEVYLDAESVLREYLRTEREILEEAKRRLSIREESYEEIGRIKREVAKEKHFSLKPEDGILWMIQQIIEVLMQSIYVEEVWAEDHVIRDIMKPIFVQFMSEDNLLDLEVRRRIKNLKEGSLDWEIKYQQEMEKMKRLKKLDQ